MDECTFNHLPSFLLYFGRIRLLAGACHLPVLCECYDTGIGCASNTIRAHFACHFLPLLVIAANTEKGVVRLVGEQQHRRLVGQHGPQTRPVRYGFVAWELSCVESLLSTARLRKAYWPQAA